MLGGCSALALFLNFKSKRRLYFYIILHYYFITLCLLFTAANHPKEQKKSFSRTELGERKLQTFFVIVVSSTATNFSRKISSLKTKSTFTWVIILLAWACPWISISTLITPPREHYSRGWLGTVDLLIKVVCFITTENNFLT
jgi:hypothetical protein